jgi:hypothetical protein
MNHNYVVREMTAAEFQPLFTQHKDSVFENVHSYSAKDLLSETEQNKLKDLEQMMGGSPYHLYLGVFTHDGQFVGWSWGCQESRSIFYMVNSGILKDHRRKGLYAALLEKCVGILSVKGFQMIYSRHTVTNNDVIIPKLKAGFIISKMEIDDRFGALIHLHFYTNQTRRQIMDYRSGQSKPDQKIKDLFKI